MKLQKTIDPTEGAKCPFCNSLEKISKSDWYYGKSKAYQLRCLKCLKYYKYYVNKKSTWTVPKGKK